MRPLGIILNAVILPCVTLMRASGTGWHGWHGGRKGGIDGEKGRSRARSRCNLALPVGTRRGGAGRGECRCVGRAGSRGTGWHG